MKESYGYLTERGVRIFIPYTKKTERQNMKRL